MSQDLEQQAPELFALARQLREQAGGAVRLRCIRVGIDENGDGGEIIAGAMPDDLRPGEVEIDYTTRLTPQEKARETMTSGTLPPPRYRGRAR